MSCVQPSSKPVCVCISMARDNYVISGASAHNAEMNVQAQVRIPETLGMNGLVDIRNMYMYGKKTRGQGQKLSSNS